MVSLIAASLRAARLSGVRAPPEPETPCLFSPWQKAHLAAYSSVLDGNDGGDGAGAAAGGCPVTQETTKNPVASRDTQSTILFTNIALMSTQLKSEVRHDKDNGKLKYPLHATKPGVHHTQSGNLLNIGPLG